MMITAFAMPVLIGGAGMAVDTAQWYAWKRELQHSVDQAAIGGAWALTNPDSETKYRTRARQEFSANLRVTKEFASEPDISLADFGDGDNNSVIVAASATKRLPFSSFLTDSGVTVRVRAQASFAEGRNYQACLIATSETGTGVDIGGNATVNAECGIAALSCDEGAVEIDGSAVVKADSIATCGTADVPEENEDAVAENVHGLKDVFADLAPPTNSTPRNYACKSSGTGNNKTNLATLSGGTYTGGVTVKCTTVFQPGIYVIDGGVLDLSANYNVTGTNVMFVLKNGATIKFGGEGNGNSISLTPRQAGDFLGTPYQDNADRYAGILVFEDRNSSPQQTHTLTGNSNSLVEGTIYLPAGELKVLGTANVASQCLQITAHKIRIAGNAHLETLCPTVDTNSAGNSAAKVRLVG